MLTIKEIIKATKGKLISKGKGSVFTSISTNSKQTKKGQLFIPLIGKNFDAHGFLNDAFKKGASGAIISKDIKDLQKNKTIIKVKNTQKALQNIAKSHRIKFKIPIIGITGSSGKTTTKDMTASILSVKNKTLKNYENFNNEIGVPLTLLSLNKQHKAAVIEMAMQRKGEIEELANIVLPKIALITNIGEAHLQFLKTKKQIALAKAEIFINFNKNNIAILNSDSEFFRLLKNKTRKARLITFGIKSSADFMAKNIKFNKNGASFNLEIFKKECGKITLPVAGIYNIYNALGAAAAAYHSGAGLKSIAKGLKKLRLSSKRTDIKVKNNVTIINDTYNANPSSMKAAISALNEQYPSAINKKTRRIAILGDMLELGKTSKSLHLQIGKFAAKMKVDILITKGFLSKQIAAGAKSAGLKKVYQTSSNEEASKKLKKIIKSNDILLIKGSRGMKMEEIANSLL